MEEYIQENRCKRADDTDLYVFFLGGNRSNDVGRNTDGCDMTV